MPSPAPRGAESLPARSGHCLFAVDASATGAGRVEIVDDDTPDDAERAPSDAASQLLVLFGGADPLKGIAYNDLWVGTVSGGKAGVDAACVAWRRQATSGSVPAPRHAFAAASTGTCLVVVGGSGESALHGDCYVLSYKSWAWRSVALPAAFPPRELLSATWCRTVGAVVVVGGRGDRENCGADVLVLKFSSGEATADAALPMARIAGSVAAANRVCATLVEAPGLAPGGPSTPLLVGGVAAAPVAPGEDPRGLMSYIDVALRLRGDGNLDGAVPVPRLEVRADGSTAGANFGIGHSIAGMPLGAADRSHGAAVAVVCGLVPNAAGQAAQVYLLPATA
jgi:hypothetical protein